MARSQGATTRTRRKTPQAIPDAPTQAGRVGAQGVSRARARTRTVAAIGAWLGTSTWPAYCAAGITAAYGLLKA